MATNDGGVSAKLADAKRTLHNVNSGNVATRSGHPFHEYSDASYSAVKNARTQKPATTELQKDAESAAAGITAKQKNVDDYVKASGE